MCFLPFLGAFLSLYPLCAFLRPPLVRFPPPPLVHLSGLRLCVSLSPCIFLLTEHYSYHIPTHPPSHRTYQQLMFEISAVSPPQYVPRYNPFVQKVCAVSPLHSNIFFLCGVLPFATPGSTFDTKWSLESGKVYIDYQSSSTCISECGNPNWACLSFWRVVDILLCVKQNRCSEL